MMISLHHSNVSADRCHWSLLALANSVEPFYNLTRVLLQKSKTS